MAISRRAFLAVVAGAAAAKALAPLMPLAPEPPETPKIPQEVWDAVEAQSVEAQKVGITQVFVSQPDLFDVGDDIIIAGDNKLYRITSIHHSTLHVDERMQEVLAEIDAIEYKPKKPRRTYPKHFRAKQSAPWAAFA